MINNSKYDFYIFFEIRTDFNSKLLSQLNEKLVPWVPEKQEVITRFHEDMLRMLVVTAIDENMETVCCGNMISEDSVAIPKSCWKTRNVVGIRKFKELGEPPLSYRITGIKKDKPTRIGENISILEVSKFASKSHYPQILENRISRYINFKNLYSTSNSKFGHIPIICDAIRKMGPSRQKIDFRIMIDSISS